MSNVSLLIDITIRLTVHRCTALPAELDNDQTAIPRCREHSEALQDAFVDDAKILWDGYGIIGDVIVCLPNHYLLLW